jgi:hypothetical protein
MVETRELFQPVRLISLVAVAYFFSPLLCYGVVINEIRTSQPGPDNQQYFELAGTPGESLAGLYYFVIGDRDSGGGSGVLEQGFVLSGTIPSNGHYLAANGATYFYQVPFQYKGGWLSGDYVYGFDLEENDNVTHILTRGHNCTGELPGEVCAIGHDLDPNDDGILDYNPWDEILDSVSIIVDPTATSSEKYYSPSVIGPDGAGPDGGAAPAHVYRYPNRDGNWFIGDYDGSPHGYEDTPGLANIPELSTLYYMLMALSIAAILYRRTLRVRRSR